MCKYVRRIIIFFFLIQLLLYKKKATKFKNVLKPKTTSTATAISQVADTPRIKINLHATTLSFYTHTPLSAYLNYLQVVKLLHRYIYIRFRYELLKLIQTTFLV